MGFHPDKASGSGLRGGRGPLLRALALDASRAFVAVACVLVALLAVSANATAKMRSTKIAPGLCETSGGGKVVDIPGFPGEMIDRRLLTDIRWLRKRYPLFITDGYSAGPEHAANGEHPLGLALDIVPDFDAGGTWAEITSLALFAEPKQDRPVQPFRWVGYDGDAGHGRGHHLHLSWSHSVVNRAGRTARTVYTMRCPTPPPGTAPTAPPPPPPPNAGGTQTGTLPGGGDGGPSSGGVKVKRVAPAVHETEGVDLDQQGI